MIGLLLTAVLIVTLTRIVLIRTGITRLVAAIFLFELVFSYVCDYHEFSEISVLATLVEKLSLNIPIVNDISKYSGFNSGAIVFMIVTLPLIFVKMFLVVRWLYIGGKDKKFEEKSILPADYSFIRLLITTIMFCLLAASGVFFAVKFGSINTELSITFAKYRAMDAGGFYRWFSWSVVQCGSVAAFCGLAIYMLYIVYLDFIRKFIRRN